MKWTTEEENILKENYNVSYGELMNLLPKRTKKAIRHKIDNLKLPRDKNKCVRININEILKKYNKDDLVIYKTPNDSWKDIICLKKSNYYIESDCHIVLSHTKDKDGYAEMHFDNDRRKIRIHRFIFETFVEKIEDGNIVRHMCHNPSCCNPLHLKQGTYQENSLDMILANRQHDQKGSKNHMSLLTENEVAQIRKLRKEGMKLKELASLYQVKVSTIKNIVYEYQWKHIKVN